MKLAVEKPSTILVIGSEGAGRDDLVDAASACDGVDVAVAESVETARTRARSDEVACLAVGDVDGDVAEFVSGIDPDVPVIYSPTNADERTVAAVAAAGAQYVPRVDGAGDAIVDTLTDAVERYRDRWTNAEESDILDTMLSKLDIPIYAKDEEARSVKAADVRGGFPPEEQYGKTDPEMFPDDHPFRAEETYQDDMQVIETGEPIYEKLIRHGDEAPLWMRETRVPRRDEDGSVVGLVGISVDVTRMQEQIRALKRRVERLENFVSHAHHDLKNPMQVATGHLQLAREREDAEDSLEKAETALDRMEEMLDDLKQVSQGRAVSDVDMDMIPFPETIRNVWETIETGSATLDIAFPGGTTIGTAESDLRPVFENLLKNAIEHGGDDVTVEVGPLASGFYVADDGPGIPEGEQDSVTEEGYTTTESGSGAGLAIVSEIALDNEWDLTITESDSGGARFEFRNANLVNDRPEITTSGETHELDEAVDVGSVTVGDRGTYDADADRWTIEADGANIWRHENDFHYVFTRVSGDVRIEGRVRDVEAAHQFSKAGFMIRGDTDEDSAYCHLGATALRGSEVLWRGRDGDPGRSKLLGDGAGRFEHYRLERIGDTVTCSVSETGHEWNAVDQREVAIDDPICVGIAVCSLTRRHPTTATVEGVTVTSLSTPRDE